MADITLSCEERDAMVSLLSRPLAHAVEMLFNDPLTDYGADAVQGWIETVYVPQRDAFLSLAAAIDVLVPESSDYVLPVGVWAPDVIKDIEGEIVHALSHEPPSVAAILASLREQLLARAPNEVAA